MMLARSQCRNGPSLAPSCPIASEKRPITVRGPRVRSVGIYRLVVNLPDFEWSKSSELRPEGPEDEPSETAERHMASMLAQLPNRGESPAGSSSPFATDDRPSDSEGRSLDGQEPGWGAVLRQAFCAPPGISFQPGQSIGRYIVLEPLGAGAMGVVYKAYDSELDRVIALKLLRAQVNPMDSARLRREAQALAKLSHPNVVQVYDVAEVDEQTFIAMELVKGKTLREWIEESEQPRPWRECINVYVEAGAGLTAAHEAGLIHRDFKPDNAIIDAKGQVRVLDFGLARRTQRPANADHEHKSDRPADLAANDLALEASLTKSGTIMGTPLYMPPEQWRGEEAGPCSDQFSFCVALYEALYGTRPFVGKTIYELEEKVAEGRIAPLDAKGPVVPPRLRNVVLRGLSPDCEQRWPSMDDLLAELRQLAAPPGRRYTARALAVGLAAMAGSGGYMYHLEMKDRCTGALAQMDGIWDDNRQQAVEAAILGTEVSYAPGTWTRVGQRLDDYANAWMDKYAEVCEATSVRGEQSEEAMRLRMRCLSKRRIALRASVDELADVNAKTVENAVDLVAGLPTLTLCDDLDRLEQQDLRIPPPEDPDVATGIETLRERLADIAAMQKTGRYSEALEKTEPVVQRADVLGYLPLLAEAQHLRGKLRADNGRYAEAEQDLRQAHSLAVAHHHDEVALDTAQLLTSVVGYRLARYAEGLQWGEMVALPLAQRCDDPVELATSLNHLGGVYENQGDYEEAKTLHQRALGIQERELGPDHPLVAMNLNNLGLVYFEQGEYEEAKGYYDRALETQERTLGSEHPDVAMSLNNLGGLHEVQGEYEKAEKCHQQALDIREKALGAEHPDVATTLNNLGNTYFFHGKYEKAKRHYERALDMWEKGLMAAHPDAAISLNNLGGVYFRLGKHKKAKGYFQRALRIQERTLGTDHPDVAYSLVELAEAALKMDDFASARKHAERAVSIRETAILAPELLAEARFMLAQTLWNEQHERSQARALAEQAREILAAAEGPGASGADLDEVEAWLATHRVK